MSIPPISSPPIPNNEPRPEPAPAPAPGPAPETGPPPPVGPPAADTFERSAAPPPAPGPSSPEAFKDPRTRQFAEQFTGMVQRQAAEYGTYFDSWAQNAQTYPAMAVNGL